MKKLKLMWPVLFLGLMVFSSCEEAVEILTDTPSACFTYSPSSIEAGTEVQFDAACTTNATGYNWKFGDGATGSGLSPKHIYTAAGVYTVELEAENENGTTKETKTITVVSASIVEHSGNIDADEVWVASAVHILTGDVSVGNAVLTIEPGAVVKFKASTELSIGYRNATSSTLIANGTADKPILFTSAETTQTKGDWEAIYFGEYTNENSSISYATLEYGGGYSENHGALSVVHSRIHFDHNLVRMSKNKGITADDGGSFLSFSDNTVKECTLAPMSIEANWAHTIGQNNVFEGKGVEVHGDVKQDNALWRKLTVPYLVVSDIAIESATGSTLTIEAGARINFELEREMSIGWNSDTYGAIIAEGTAAEPIIFSSSAVNKKAGDWESLYFGSGTLSTTTLKYCTVEYGAGYSENHGAISVQGSKLTVAHCTITNTEFSGITLTDGASFVGFENNTFDAITNYSVEIEPNWVHTVGGGNTFVDNKGILVHGGNLTQADVTWIKHAAPYVIEGHVEVGSKNTSILRIAPGAVLKFMNDVELVIAYDSNTYGQLIADGTDEQIVFTTASPVGAEVAGDWRGIYFGNGTAAGSLLKNCKIQYAGGYSEDTGSITIYSLVNGTPTISGCTIMDSKYQGIYVDGHASPSIEDSNVFERIGVDNIHYN